MACSPLPQYQRCRNEALVVAETEAREMTEQDGLIFAFQLDGRGGGRSVGWDEIRAWRPDGGLLWMHLDYEGAEVQRWFSEESALDAVIADALTEQETRPRSFTNHDGCSASIA